jgi:hypothetical protein
MILNRVTLMATAHATALIPALVDPLCCVDLFARHLVRAEVVDPLEDPAVLAGVLDE